MMSAADSADVPLDSSTLVSDMFPKLQFVEVVRMVPKGGRMMRRWTILFDRQMARGGSRAVLTSDDGAR